MGKYSSFILGDGQDNPQATPEKTPMGSWSSFVLGDTGEQGAGSSTDALQSRLQFKDDLVRKLDYIREQSPDKDNFDIGGGVKASEALKFVNSSGFNADDMQRMAPLIQSIDQSHKAVSGKRNILEVGADAFKRGYVRAGAGIVMSGIAMKPGEATKADIEELKTLQKVGNDYETRNAPRSVGGVQDVMAADGIGEKASRALRFGVESIAENLPQMAASVAGSIAGGIIAGPAGAAVGAGVGSIPMNLQEAVGDQVDEGLGLNKGYAFAQTAGYSAIDSILSVEKMAGGIISQVFKKTAASAGRKAFVGTLKKVAGMTLLGATEEAINEPAQSAGVGRLRRYFQTGSGLRQGETVEQAVWEGLNDSAGGFAAGLGFGGGSSAIQYSRDTSEARTARKNAFLQNVVTGTGVAMSDLDQFDSLAVMQAINAEVEATHLDTFGVQADPQKRAKMKSDLLNVQREAVAGMSDKAKLVWNAAHDVLATDFSMGQVDKAKKSTFSLKNVVSTLEDVGDGNQMGFDKDSGIGMAKGADGTVAVYNQNGLKMPADVNPIFDNLQQAAAFAEDLARFNEQRMEKLAPKFQLITQIAQAASPGANVRIVDTPAQLPASVKKDYVALLDSGAPGQAMYDKNSDTVYIVHGNIQTIGDAIVNINHEAIHSEIQDMENSGEKMPVVPGSKVEERLVTAFENRIQDPSAWAKAKRTIAIAAQNVMNKAGLNTSFADADIAEAFIDRVRGRMKVDGQTVGRMETPQDAAKTKGAPDEDVAGQFVSGQRNKQSEQARQSLIEEQDGMVTREEPTMQIDEQAPYSPSEKKKILPSAQRDNNIQSRRDAVAAGMFSEGSGNPYAGEDGQTKEPFADNRNAFGAKKDVSEGEQIIRDVSRTDRLRKRMEQLSEQTRNTPRFNQIVGVKKVSSLISGLLRDRWNDMSVEERRTMFDLRDGLTPKNAGDLNGALEMFALDLDTRSGIPQSQEAPVQAPQSQAEPTAVTMPPTATEQAQATPAATIPPISPAVTPTTDNATLNQVATPSETDGKGIVADTRTDESPAKATFLLNKDGSREYNTVELPIEELTLSKEVDQFKEGANPETGEVEPLQGEKYERVGTAPIVVWERLDGSKEVITGRHRLALARRLGEKTIPAQIVKESEGWTKTDAAALDAESNIRDGQGSVKDYARYFKYAKLDQKTADSRGLLSRKRGQYGYIIGTSASNDLFANYSAGEIGDDKAYEIAKVAPGNEEAQRVGYTYAKNHTAEETAQYMRSIISQKREQESTGGTLDLFGNDDSWMKQAEAEAKAAATIMRGMNDEISALKAAKSLSAEKRKSVLSKYGVNAGDTASINKRLEKLEEQRSRFDNWHLNPDLTEMVRNAVEGVKPVKSPVAIVKQEAPAPSPDRRNDGELFEADQMPFNLDGGETVDGAKAEAEVKAEKKRAEEEKRKLDSAPQLDLGGETKTAPTMEEMVKDARRWAGAAIKADGMYAPENRKARLGHMQMTTKGDMDAYLMRKFGVSETTARDVSNELTRKNLSPDTSAEVKDFAGEPWADAATKQAEQPAMPAQGDKTPAVGDGGGTQTKPAIVGKVDVETAKMLMQVRGIPSNLAGDRNKAMRQNLIERITGKRPTVAQAGIHALEKAIDDALGLSGIKDTTRALEDIRIDAIKKVIKDDIAAQSEKKQTTPAQDVIKMSYDELVRATYKGTEARRTLGDLPPQLYGDVVAAQRDGVERTEKAIIKWLADKRGTLSYPGDPSIKDILKNLPLQDANVLDGLAGEELNRRENKPEQPRPPTAPRTEVKSPIANVSDAKKARLAAIQAELKGMLGRTSAGIDPKFLTLAVEMASIYVEGGVKTFAQFAQAVKQDMADVWDKIKNELSTVWYRTAQDNDSLEEVTGKQAKAVIDAIDAESSTSKSNVAQAAELMAEAIKDGQLSRLRASKIMADVYGGTDAEGKYSSKDTTDVSELAVNMIIRDSKDYPTNVTSEKAVQVVNELKELISRMPTQTTRTAETDKMQQFSTPPPLAYVVNWVASIKNTDTVIEPSAGIGGIAVFAHNAGASVITNELSDRRSAILKELRISDASFSVNAEYLNALLDPKIRSGEIARPTVVVMNPPFSNSATTDKSNTIIGGKHIEEALNLLEEGGRLVAIVGEGMAADKPRLAGWWKKIGQTYSVRANIGVNGEEYRKYGTTFGNQIIVIDKTGPTKEGSTIVGNVKSIEELPLLLKEVQNERANLEQSSSKPSGINTAEDTGAGNTQGSGLSSATGGLQSGRPGQGASTSGRPTKNGNGKPSVQKPGRPAQVGNKDGAVSDTERSSSDSAGRDSGLDSGPAIEGLELKTKSEESKVVAEDEVFTSYSPIKAIVEGSKKHPTPLVESSAMASVDAPDVSYSPKLPKHVITDGILSDAQIETVVYAGQAHQNMLPDGSRMGYFIGDGTGVGKGREIAGIITDNWNNGRKKAVWVSKKAELINDAERDLTALGVKAPLIDASKNGGNSLVGAGNGVAFIPYTSLARDNPGVAPDSNQLKTANGNSQKKSRIEKLRDWLGADFDGVIAFDEVHLAGNAIDIKGKRGVKKASKNGMSVVDLQKILPKARVVYVSATGATEISNLAYGDRLGIWGPGTPFANKQSFFNKISAGGMSSMEIVARDLKAMGRYIARTLSFKGVDNEQITHTLTEDQKRKYDEASKSWQMVFQNIDSTMARTGANNNGKARGSALSKFYGAQQRFYNQLLTSLQMPSVIVDAKKSLANGESVVFQIVNTNEAALGRELTSSAEEEDFDPNDIDLSPMSVLLQYIESCYPTALYQETQDDNGNSKWEVVTDADGNPVQDPQAVRERADLIDRLSRMRMPGNPLELILDTFGVDNVAEVTGRSQRVVKKPDASGQITTQIEKGRSSRHAIADTKDFNSGKKRVLVFSDAGGTGFSYHAGSNFKNQQRRIHYLIQAGWRADAALQGFGRTHRSDQVSAPFYKLVSTDIKGHKRFISTIARRLSQLGSLTSGDRSAAGSGVLGSEDNLENDYAQDSLDSLFLAIFNGRVSGFTLNALAKKMGFSKTVIDSKTGELTTVNMLIDPETGSLNDTKLPTVPQFLNRILMLEVDEQNGLFDEFMERMTTRIENAKLDGSYDPGLQTLKAVDIRKVSEDVVYEQQGTSAKTKIIDVDVDHKVTRIPFSKVQAMQGGMFVKNNKSGHVYALFHGPGRTEESGRVVETWRRIGPHNTDIIPKYDVQTWSTGNYTEIKDQTDARLVWDEQYDNSPKVRTERQSYIAGAFLPVWDRIGIERPQIWRVTPKGEGSFLGARIPSKMVADVRRKMGAGRGSKLSADNVLSSIIDGGQSYDLANGWRLKRSVVLGERRIEVVGIEEDSQIREFVNFIGGFSEKIGWTTRCFIPTDVDQGAKSLEKLLKKSPIIDDSETASDQTDATRFRRAVTPEQDAAYMAAVRGGDTDTAQRMVDDAAKEAGYTVGPAYHGTGKSFTVFNGQEHWFSRDRDYAEEMSIIKDNPNVIEAYLRIENPLSVTMDISEFGVDYYEEEHLKRAKKERKDGVIFTSDNGSFESYVTFSPEQIKSADAITRDDAGEVIPLSERFNDATGDTRFRRGVSPRDAAEKRYVRAQPSTDPRARALQAEVEVAYAYDLTPTTVKQAQTDARIAYERDEASKITAQMNLLAGKTSDNGDINIDAKRMATDKIATDDLTMSAVSDPTNDNKIATAMLGIWRWYERGTDVARALQLRFDPCNTPEGRRAWIMRTILAPTKAEAEIIKKAQNTKEAVTKLMEKAKYARKVLEALKKKDKDVSKLTADQLMDDVFVAQLLQEIAVQRSGWGEMVHEWWRNAILSAPTTQIVNTVGNAGHAALEAFVQRPIEALMNTIVGNKDAATFNSNRAMYKAISPSIHAANKAFLKSWATERTVTGPGSSKIEEADVAIKGTAGKIIRVPQRLMSATDEWFKTIFMAMLTADYATREFDKLVKEGKKTEAYRDTYVQAQTSPDSAAYVKAWGETLRWSFQQKPGHMATSIMHWRNDPQFGFLLKFIFPFVKTPANIIASGIRKTPLGSLPYMYNMWKGNYKGGDAMRLGAEQAVGMVLMASLYALMKGDDDDELNRPRITGSRRSSATTSKGAKEAEMQNTPPMSIRIGDKWVSYARLEPVATMVATMVDALTMFDQAKDGKYSDIPETLFSSIRGNLADKTFLQGVGNMVSIIEGDELALQKAVTSTLAGFNPNIIRSTARALDPYIRDMKNRDKGAEYLKTAAERFGQTAMPSASLAPIPKLDKTGKPIEREGGALYNATVPFKVQDATKTTKVDGMLSRWNNAQDKDKRWYPATPDPVKVKIGKEEIAMTDEEYVEYQRIAGEHAATVLGRQSFNFNNPTERDIERVKDIYENARKLAREQIRGTVVRRWRSEQGR